MARVTRSLVIEIPHTDAYAISKSLEGAIIPLIRDFVDDRTTQILEDFPNQKIVSRVDESGLTVTVTETFRPVGENITEYIIDVETGLIAGKTIAVSTIISAISVAKAIESGYKMGARAGKHS